MPTEEFERLKEALRKAPTPEARKAASDAMKHYLERRKVEGSKPMFVSLGYGKTYPHGIPLEEIPNELERNPEFFDLMRRIVTKER